jgi:hypothetical protein
MIESYYDKGFVIRRGSGPPPTIHPAEGQLASYGLVVPPNGGTSDQIPYEWQRFITDEDEEHMARVEYVIFFSITARYSTPLGERFDVGFCYLFYNVTKRFVLSGSGPSHNYKRKMES